MIERYNNADIAGIWSTTSQYQRWLDIERTWIRCLLDIDPPMVPGEVVIHDIRVNTYEIEHFETVTHHDVRAFLMWLERELPSPLRRYLHLGLTSSDVVDTGTALAVRGSVRVLDDIYSRLIHYLYKSAASAPPLLPSYSHGQPARSISSAHFYRRLEIPIGRAFSEVSVSQLPIAIGGPTGEWSSLPPGATSTLLQARSSFNVIMSTRYGVKNVAPRSQALDRSYYTKLAQALSRMSNALSQAALHLRFYHLRGMLRIGGTASSSAMPNKSNPVRLEKVCGMARVARGYALMAGCNQDTWELRDISNSSVERVWMPDLFHTVAHQVSTLCNVIAKMQWVEPAIDAELAAFPNDPFGKMVALQATGMHYNKAWRTAKEDT